MLSKDIRMQIELVESIRLKDYNEKLIDEMPLNSIDRRNFLKLFTVSAAGLLIPTTFYAEQAKANPLVFGFILRYLFVTTVTLSVGSLITGELTIDNETSEETTDDVDLVLIKEEKLEDKKVIAKKKEYNVKPYTRNTYRYKIAKNIQHGKYKFHARGPGRDNELSRRIIIS